MLAEITPARLLQQLQQGQIPVLLDVRQYEERKRFHIGGLHIPLEALMSRRREIPVAVPVIVYCEKGIRSAIAIQRLILAGHAQLYNLRGGMAAWRRVCGDAFVVKEKSSGSR